MSKVILDASDYEKIMDFALLDPFSDDYYKRVLSLLKTHFTGNLAAYTSWSKENRLLSYCSIGFTDDFMRRAHNIYIHDEIRNLVREQYSSNFWSGVFYSQDIDPYTYGESKTIAYLNENHMHYFGIMVLSRVPRENIVLCKTDKEGPFSQREKEIIQRIYNLLSHQAQIRNAHNKNRQVIEVINSHCINKKVGLIITDEEFNVLTYNEAAISLCPRKLSLKHVDDIVSYVFSLFGNEDSGEEDWAESERTVNKNGRSYTIEEIKSMDEEGKQAKHYLIVIRMNKRHGHKVDRSVSASYGLTEREIDVAELIAAGCTNNDIAEQLHITVYTVKIHVSNLFRKLGVHSRMEAVMKLTKSSGERLLRG